LRYASRDNNGSQTACFCTYNKPSLRVWRTVSTDTLVQHAQIQRSSLTHGRLGAFGISFGLPILVYVFAFACNDVSGCPAPSLLHPRSLNLETLKREVGWHGPSTLLNTNAALGVAGYYLLSLTLYAFLPAQTMEGVELDSGGKLKYRFNGKLLARKCLLGRPIIVC
jgi:hypothetical protein